MTSDAMPMRPERICSEISERLPPDGVVVSDTGHSGMWTGAMIEFSNPRQGFVALRRFAGMGISRRDWRQVRVARSCGRMFHRRRRLLLPSRRTRNRRALRNQSRRRRQQQQFAQSGDSAGECRLQGQGYGALGRNLALSKSVDFTKLGEALGCAAFRVDKPGQLKELLPKAFAMNRPVVIDVVTEENALAKAWAPGGAVDTDLIAPGFERVVDRDPPLDSIAQGLTFGEGPVWDKRSGQLYWVDIIGNTIWKWKPGVGREVVLSPSGHANGMTFDKEGRLDGRRLVQSHDLPLRARRHHYDDRVEVSGQEIQQPERHRRAIRRLDVPDRFGGRARNSRHGRAGRAAVSRHDGRVPADP